jgi:hypothetical protein
MSTQQNEELPLGCSGIDWCYRHQIDHGHPELSFGTASTDGPCDEDACAGWIPHLRSKHWPHETATQTQVGIATEAPAPKFIAVEDREVHGAWTVRYGTVGTMFVCSLFAANDGERYAKHIADLLNRYPINPRPTTTQARKA